jgi:hypothetical protein
MKKLIFCLFLLNLLSACETAREGFTLKKKDNSDEFLVEKKSPLVMPPNYNDLPEPKDFQINTESLKDDEFEKIINNSKNYQSKTDTRKTSIEQSVIEKIK